MGMRTSTVPAKVRPLILSYWGMPLATGFAVTIVAAGMLIETLVLANRIDANVAPIKTAGESIKLHTDGIAVLNSVDTTAKAIKTAADPLSGQATTILSTVGSIQANVASIDAETTSIRGRAAGIDGTVSSIAPHVLAIAVPAESIQSRLGTTLSDLNAVVSLVQGIKGDTQALLSPAILPNIDAHAHSIDCKLALLTGGC